MDKILVFIDWDDTLFPTEWIKTSDVDLNNPNEESIALFQELDKLITDMIVGMVFLGDILIVTNGSSNWVNQCLNLLPNFKQIIEGEVISVTSARDLFSKEHKYDNWKKLTPQMFFNEHISTKEGIFKILSFGDSEAEHDAVTELKVYNPIENQKRIIGSIKFMKYPSLNQLVMQLQLIRMMNKEILEINDDHFFNLEDLII